MSCFPPAASLDSDGSSIINQSSGLAFAKYFIFLRILRHYKVIALALGAPGVGAGGRPAGGPEMLAQLGTTRS